jgi:hypothetical protein
MLWLEFVQNYRKFLELYFKNSCARCVYRKVDNVDTNSYFEDVHTDTHESEYEVIDFYTSDAKIYGFNMLCSDCILDKPRELEDVLFEILTKILEDVDQHEFARALQILNESNIIEHPKEVLFLHYVKQCKNACNISPLNRRVLSKLLILGVNANYRYSNIRYENIFTVLPIRILFESIRGTVAELLHLLQEFGYFVFYIKDGAISLNELGRFLLLG